MTMNNTFNNRSYNISIIQNISYTVANIKVVPICSEITLPLLVRRAKLIQNWLRTTLFHSTGMRRFNYLPCLALEGLNSRTDKEPNCAQSFIWPYFIILLLFIPSARCSGTFMEREREFAFVYNICMCTWSSVRTCVLCRNMRVNVFVKLWLVLTCLFYM